MLKYFFMFMFMLFLNFYKNLYWFIQNLFLMLLFFCMSMNFLNMYWMSISYYFGCDIISYGMILLSIWISSLMLMASEKIYSSNNYFFFLFIIMILLLMLILTFTSMNLFMFYVFFESSLIPTLFLILGWGYQPERLQAGLYMLFYTLLASLPMLMGIFYNYYLNNTMIFNLLNMNYHYYLFYFSMIMAFLVKMPMYMFHLWLPKAHVEAPISGSMILAGVLLKLGGYGLLRIFPYMMKLNMKFNYIWMIVSIMGGFYVSLMCLRQLDLKSLIAYSSVAHMGIVLAGLMSLMLWGLMGSYTLMIAHGLCSSGLFCLVNMNYERIYSRSMLINKGMMNFMPSMTFWWFLFSASNMACPPTLNLLGEISLLNSIISWSWLSMINLSFMSFFSAVYSLYLYSFQHGKSSTLIYSYSGGLIREYLLLFLHWLPLNLLIIKSDMCMMWL